MVVLVALDSNVVDLVEVACRSSARIDAMEAMEPPPHFEDLSPQQEVEVFACYWLLAMAPAWRSTLYTFSDFSTTRWPTRRTRDWLSADAWTAHSISHPIISWERRLRRAIDAAGIEDLLAD